MVAAADRPIILEMTDVSVMDMEDPERVVLEHVNWSVRAGDYWVIGGLHASGKSNLIATLAGILPTGSGEYRAFGKKMGSPAELERSPVRHGLGIVFDGGRLIHDLTIAENVALPMRYHENLEIEEALARVQTLLELVAADHLASSYPAAIGRNWQQRTGLARALALQPEVLLLDNALTGLDPRDAHWWLQFLDALWTGRAGGDRKPMTLIATADDLRPWRHRADKFALLKEKQFIVLGDRDALVEHREPLLKELMPALSRET